MDVTPSWQGSASGLGLKVLDAQQVFANSGDRSAVGNGGDGCPREAEAVRFV
jgi:hypothetical protein